MIFLSKTTLVYSKTVDCFKMVSSWCFGEGKNLDLLQKCFITWTTGLEALEYRRKNNQIGPSMPIIWADPIPLHGTLWSLSPDAGISKIYYYNAYQNLQLFLAFGRALALDGDCLHKKLFSKNNLNSLEMFQFVISFRLEIGTTTKIWWLQAMQNTH